MEYSYESVAEASRAGQTSSAPGYDMNGYLYHASPRASDLATPVNQYSYNSYSTTASPLEESTTSHSVYSFNAPVNGHSTYVGPANRPSQPSSAYSPYLPSLPSSGPLSHPQSTVSPHTMQRSYTNHSGSFARYGYQRAPPRSRPSSLHSLPAPVSGYQFGTPQGGSAGESLPGDFEATASEANGNAVLATGEACDFHQDCPADDRLIHDLYRKHRNVRGEAMWDTIGAEFHKQYPDKKLSTARIQMKHTRAVRKHLLWPKEAFSAMIEIYMDEEKKKYTHYASRLKETLGDKYWDFKPADVEAFLCRAGIEDAIPEPSSKTRRRNHQQGRQPRHSDVGRSSTSHVPAVWNTGYAPSSVAGQQHLPLPGSNQSMMAVPSDYEHHALAAVQTPVFSREQETAFQESLDGQHGRIDSDDAMRSLQ
ncbi:hypothetical protein SEPCBS57363_003128 [Sporothrix epigloea]|uniref:Clr5 domain-containing protein n=1 Tax=Sporothrix epigloea TaxID=1892477 RepID=A0ABP0DJT3_9PEZI